MKIGKNVARGQHSQILNSKTSRKSAYFKIKDSLNFTELCEATDHLDKNYRHHLKEPIFGNALPDSYEELGHSETSFISKSFIKEINWCLVNIRKYRNEINLFLKYKEEFEKSFLLSDYPSAERCLEKIEKGICFSLWTLENRFLLNEFKYSALKNKELLINFNKENKGSGTVKWLAHYLSIRAEKALTISRYNLDLDNALNRSASDQLELNKEYYHFKLSFLNFSNYKFYQEILGNDFQFSIVDKYLSLRNVLTSLLTSANQFIDQSEGDQLIKAYLLSRTNYLIRKIEDPILYKLKLFGSEKVFPAFEIQQSEKDLEIIDRFTSGLYIEVEQEIKPLLVDRPTQFDLYVLYIESLIYQNKPFAVVKNYETLQNQILNEIYKIISLTGNPSDAGMNLLRIANNLTSSVLSYGIIDFVLYQTKGQIERKLFARLSYNFANPYTFECFTSKNDQLGYLNLLSSKFPKSLTINFLKDKINDPTSVTKYKGVLPDEKYHLELGKSLFGNGNYENAAEIFEYLTVKYRSTIPVLESSLRSLYATYERLKRYDDCIKLYVSFYFTNAFLVEKIETENLLKIIRSSRFKNVLPTIELPIFYTIVKADENEIHISYEKFNISKSALKPTQLFAAEKELEKEKFIFYLRYTCDPEILKHSIHIRGSKEKLEERLSICQHLLKIDSKNVSYTDEIKSIQNILIIQQGSIELDESKIYVNEPGILNTELKDYEAIFNRFRVIAEIADKRGLLMLLKGKLTTVNFKESNSEKDQIEYSTNPVSDLYSELFEAVKEKFLYSKFGIVAYLSTRIRHGVLLGEIRPIFEKHKLITQKEGQSSEYKINEYWENQFTYYSDTSKSQIQYLLRDFSNSVDGLIYDIIKKHLQVKDNLALPEGWFDYEFSENDLVIYSAEALDLREFNDFVKSIFEKLWIRTDENLELIRGKIQKEVARQFDDLFNKLESDISGLLPSYTDRSIITAIKLCSTDVQMAVHRISNWFRRSGTQISDFNLEDLIDIVVSYSDKSKRLELEKIISFNDTLKGEFYTHFADLIRIFIENILKHSDEHVGKIKTIINVEKQSANIVLTIKNEITKPESVAALAEVREDKKINVDKLIDEGKSGFHKAMKILQSDLKNDKNIFGTRSLPGSTDFEVFAIINYKDLIK